MSAVFDAVFTWPNLIGAIVACLLVFWFLTWLGDRP